MKTFFRKKILLPICKVILKQIQPPQTHTSYNKFVNKEQDNNTQTYLSTSESFFADLETNFLQRPVKQKVTILTSIFAVVYLGGLALLSFAWYRKQRRSSFHFFNDNPEWQQMDKFGHAYTAFYLSYFAFHLLLYAGVERKTALNYGGWVGAILMTPIEILDGFSDGYGASWGDEVANIAGSAFFIWQQKKWGEVKLQPQFFFKPSPFAALRPELLGKNLAEQWLKDYNGQVYWLRFNHSFLQPFGKLMIGYGAGNMIYGRPEQNIAAGYKPYREIYIGFEVNQNKIVSQKILTPTQPFKNLLGLPTFWWKFRLPL
jgi:hypothetical protein